jgi:hypothetical protein
MKILIATLLLMTLSSMSFAGPYVIHTHKANFIGESHIKTGSVTRLGYYEKFNNIGIWGEAGLTDHAKESVEFGVRYMATPKLLVRSKIEITNDSTYNSTIKTDIRYNF